MTTKKDLKRRVRERMRANGEPYTAALAKIRAEAPPVAAPRRSVIASLHDLTPLARSVGLTCFAEVGHDAWMRVQAVESAESWFQTALTKIRQLVLGASDERGARDLATALFDESARARHFIPPDGVARLRFVNRVASGIRGIAPTGDALAIDVLAATGRPRLVHGTILPGYGPRRPTLLVSVDPQLEALRWGPALLGGPELYVTGRWSGR